MEEWKVVEGFPDYEISNQGRLLSHQHHRGMPDHFVVGKRDKDGYIEYGLYNKGVKKYVRAHRLVALHFIPNPYNLPLINHKDEDRSNNCIENLEWCTALYNNHYSDVPGKTSKKLKGRDFWKKGVEAARQKGCWRQNLPQAVKASAEKKRREVAQYTLSGELVRVYPSTRDAEKDGFNHTGISFCCRGLYKHHRGYIWKYNK